MKSRFSRLLPAVCLILGFANSVWPQSTLYFDRTMFTDAAQAVPGNQQSISFATPFIEGPSVTIADMTFTGRYLLRGPLSAGVALYNFDSDIPLSIDFANGARAFGADFSSLLSEAGYTSFTATVSLSNGEVFNFTAPTNPDSQFLGFISPTPITHLTFSDGGLFGFGNLHEELIANIVVVTVPEPGVSGLFALGALFFRRRWFVLWKT